MKKIKKLSLNKETISLLSEDNSLSPDNLNQIMGGYTYTNACGATSADTCDFDFDTPTINDNCFGETGTTTFGSNCGWCGFLHETS